ncbi:hypothetical protein ACFLTH_02390 [Bacteroidota bacterium]
MILFIALLTLIINVPFGYWRANVKRFSLQWFLAVHLPVPLIIAIRIFSEIGFELNSFPLIVAAFFVGQYLGGMIHNRFSKKMEFNVSSCLVLDLVKYREKYR